jgi:4-oxalocrotonate tautomerase
MPLVTLDLLEGRPREEIAAISDSVHNAMVELLGVPQRDRFQIVTEHRAGSLSFDPDYLDIERGDGFVLVRLTLAGGRSTAAKQGFYRRLCELLVDRVGMRPEDLAVVMVENERADWSFGLGEASYLERPPEAWR